METGFYIGIIIGVVVFIIKQLNKVTDDNLKHEKKSDIKDTIKKEDNTYTISLNLDNFELGDKPSKLSATTNQPLKLKLSIKNTKNDLIKKILETKIIKGKYYIHGYWNSTYCVIVDYTDDKVLGCLLFDDFDGNIMVERIFHIKINNKKFRFENEGMPFDYNMEEFKEEKEFKVTLFSHKREKYKI
ncbi:hypothetical protein [Aliarcobacter butzleri]|uniref:hypothetical protein n=1 Tax=Aliarcobacter butzleri TaxID=28197 RepID=UPI001EDC4199|nr:hypothetical protein [Aliarcobacter butzleri]MCG3671975.1 hypothetical protein [Aliarcobacter butzleri]MCG3680260.1 hypothetical protein [Aliarcobacter butzleri]